MSIRRLDEPCSESPMRPRRCRATPHGRRTVSGWCTRTTAPATLTSGNTGLEILTQSGSQRRRSTSHSRSGLRMVRSIVFRSERDGGGLYVMPASGGVERLVANFGYEPMWSPDGTLILFKRSAVLPDLPTIYVVGLDGKPPRPVRPDVLGQFHSLHAAWHPDSRTHLVWGTIGEDDLRFLTVPLMRGSPTTPELSAKVQRTSTHGVSGAVRLGGVASILYFEGRADDTQNIWRVTVDPLTEDWIEGPERLTTGAGHETNLAISATARSWPSRRHRAGRGSGRFPRRRPGGESPASRIPSRRAAPGEVDFDVRADGSKKSPIDGPRWPQRAVGTFDGRGTGAPAALEHGLTPGETAMVAGWRRARVPALRDTGQLRRRRGPEYRRQR